MANVYLKLIEDARRLPSSYRAMGTPPQTFVSTRGGTSVTGWEICQFAHYDKRNGPRDWWSTAYSLVVDESGQLWELVRGWGHLEDDPGRESDVLLSRVDGERLRSWHVNNWDFGKMKHSVEAMI
jgi:hypothetical protein